MNALEIKNLTKSYRDFTLDNLNLTLPNGCILGLIGENGAGKSTTIKLILDIIHKDSGTITLLGHDSEHIPLQAKEDIGVVLDEVGFPECLTAKQADNIMKYTFSRWDSAMYRQLLVKLSIPENKPFSDFSRGMKMKLGIAVALSHHPKLLLLDEATSGLDPVVRDEVVDMFSEFTRDESHSILISSHIVSDLEKLCDYIAFLHQGKLLFCEEKDRLLESYGLFVGTRQQLEELAEDAVLSREDSGFGGVRAILRRDAVPACLPLEKPTVEDIILAMVRKEQNR